MVFWLSSQQKCHSLKVPFLCPQFLFPHVCLLSNHFHGSKESKCFQFKHAKIWKSWHNEMNFAPNKISALWRLNPSCNVVTIVSHILHAHDHAISTLFARNRVDIQLKQLKSGLNFAAAWCLRMLHWLPHDKKHWVLSKKFMGKAVKFSASRALLQMDHLQLLGAQTVKHAFQRMSKCDNLCSLQLAQAVVERNCQKTSFCSRTLNHTMPRENQLAFSCVLREAQFKAPTWCHLCKTRIKHKVGFVWSDWIHLMIV